MSYHKVGFLSDQGGNANGIGDYVQELDALGIPAVVMSNNDVKGIADALQLINAGSTTSHVMVHRVVRAGMDVPNYNTTPAAAATEYYDLIIPHVHSMVKTNRDKVWVQLGNELDKNRSEWIAEWCLESELLWGALGYKICVINWSTGEPEPEHWRGTMMSSLLRLAYEKRDTLAIGLHEYSLTTDSIDAGYPYLFGRFQDLVLAAEELGVGHPTMLVTEFGWTHDQIPAQPQALADIAQAAQLYGQYPTLLGAGTWYLGQGWDNIANQVQPLIVPVTQQSKDYVAPPQLDPDPDDTTTPEPDETFEEFYWRRSVELQTVSLNPDALLQSHINTDGFNIVEGEFWDAYDNQLNAAQAGEHLQTGERRVYITPVPAAGQPWQPPSWFGEPTDDVLHGFTVAAPFGRPFRTTDYFNAPRSYGNGKHEGQDFDIFTAALDSQEAVLCGVDGIVVPPDPMLPGYGSHVVVETTHRGNRVRVWYCHLDAVYVNIGDLVRIGTHLGELGTTGNSTYEHLHLNIQVPGNGLAGYVVPDVVNPEAYVSMEPQAVGTFDIGSYLLPPNEPNRLVAGTMYGDIVILANNWGQGDERQQLQQIGDYSFVTKNAQYEKRLVTSQWIDLLIDTSPDGVHYYEVSGHWLPRYMRVGETYVRTETVKYYRKDNCQQTTETTWTTAIRFAAHHDQHVIADSGLVLQDVVEGRWIVDGTIEEWYLYAKNLGLVEWRNRANRHSYATEIIPFGNQHNNQMEQIPCL
jgi:murein DD-endopeptidase MepM/ murein hydrolase activator NlpD